MRSLLTFRGPPPGTEASSTGDEDGGSKGAATREGEGEYVTKIRSLFPSLKVRDGKRILMKKSHTYYEQRAADANPNPDATERFPAPSEAGRKFGGGGRPGKGSGDGFGGGGDGRMVDGQKPPWRLKGVPAADPAAAAIAGKGENRSGNDPTSSGNTEKAKRREAKRLLKKKAARAPARVGRAEGARTKGDGGGVGAAGASDLPDDGSGKRNRLAEDDVDPAEVKSKKKKRRREAKDETTDAPEERNPRRDSVKAVVEPIASTAQDKKQRNEKKSEANASAKAPAGGGGRTANEGSGSGGGGGSGGGDDGDKDPYSSSEELPVPGKRAGKSADGDAKGGVGGGAKRAAQEGDRESGVVSVVLNRKRKGARGAKGKAWQTVGGGGGLQRDDGEAGGSGGEGGFSVEGMLAARGQRETVGLGLGVSAWG